jgi:large subunit ribosomal protein L13
MKTFVAKEKEITRKWYVVDAKDKGLGRLSTQIATILRGKNKTIFTPNVDCGDYVVVINARHIKLTANKMETKVYFHHSGYNGGLSEIKAKDVLVKFPERLVEKAVLGMLPHNSLGRKMGRKLFVFPDETHDKQPQKPEVFEVK